jgi:hypothetical protein
MKTIFKTLAVLVVLGGAALGQNIPINTNIAGFQHGQAPDVVANVVADLGMTHRGDCGPRRGTNGEYVDCQFDDANGRSIEVVFHHGWLHEVSYTFPISKYNPILNDLTKKFGSPRVVTDPHDPSYVVSKDWGSLMRDNISLIRQYGGKTATLDINYSN